MVGICCAAFLTGPPSVAANPEVPDPQHERIKFSGYTQSRYTDKQGSRGTLAISRARLKMKGQVTDRDKVTLQIDANSKNDDVTLRDAYLDHLVASQGGVVPATGTDESSDHV